MTYALGARSRQRLAGLDPRLVAVVELAITLSTQDFTVNEGVRSAARQAKLYAQGRTAPGPIVTHVRVSNHQPVNGLGRAVDLYPWVNGKPLLSQGAPTPQELVAYVEIAKAMFAAAARLGVPLRWGANWDMDDRIREHGETDNPHFEIPRGAP